MLKIWGRVMNSWTKLVFRERYGEITRKIKVLRLLEEVMELAQAEDVSAEEALIIRNQVWNKPKGECTQEMGGVLTCLAGYAALADMDLEECFWAEYTRIIDPAIIEKVRYRNLEGDKIGFDKQPKVVDNPPVSTGMVIQGKVPLTRDVKGPLRAILAGLTDNLSTGEFTSYIAAASLIIRGEDIRLVVNSVADRDMSLPAQIFVSLQAFTLFVYAPDGHKFPMFVQREESGDGVVIGLPTGQIIWKEKGDNPHLLMFKGILEVILKNLDERYP